MYLQLMWNVVSAATLVPNGDQDIAKAETLLPMEGIAKQSQEEKWCQTIFQQ